ncbi:JHBP domain containing protein [Asbolus verrucosus]|uniref:JHBP domain containing protein n=1 Tax=Asbolus verrucosus TaxID=1661398 RepID=A0A482VNQ8_ASBVE|nr:JHBP domain containing protein [Asbolus verrucosus]
MKKTAVICAFLATLCASSRLPSTFTKCNRKQSDFNSCLRRAVQGALGRLTEPIKEVGLPNLDPLEVSELTIGAGASAVDFDQNFKHVKVFGFAKSNCSSCEMNFEEKTLRLECFSPEIRMEFEYEVEGRILVVPLYGKGAGAVTLDRMKYVVDFSLEEYKKKGKKYFKAVDSDFAMEPELVKIKIENLFDGDKALTDSVNRLANENWRLIFDDIRTNYQDALAQISLAIFNKFLGKVSISELFGEE